MTHACSASLWHSAVSFSAATLARFAIALWACCFAPAAMGKMIEVGPQRFLRIPSQAAVVAQPGDTVVIDRGTYADCAVWRTSNLVIEAREPGVTLTGKTCEDRGIFIIHGHNVTVRGITFADARVKWRNGAGIRAFGNHLTVEDSRFLRNENGILVGGSADSVVVVSNSEFIGNGSCEGLCAHGLYAGAPIRLLRVTGCRFFDTRIAHHIKSRARNTIIEDTRIEDGADGTASYLIELPNGGNGLIMNNILQKGRRSDNRAVAISIGVEGVTNPTDTLILRDNGFVSDLTEPTLFVRNSSTAAVQLIGNRFTGNIVPLGRPATADTPPAAARPAQ